MNPARVASLHRRLARELARALRTHAELADALEREAATEPANTVTPPTPALDPVEIRAEALRVLHRAKIRTKSGR